MTSTASVDYTLEAGRPDGEDGPVQTVTDQHTAGRTARGTLATMLGEATVIAATTRSDRLRSDGFSRRVRRAVTDAVGSDRTQIVATWRPFPGSLLRARLTIGPEPPADADVRAATIQVDSGARGRPITATRAHDGGFEAVATVLAARSVRVLFPVEATRAAIRAGGPLSVFVERRYRTTARRYGVTVDLSSEADVRTANRRLRRAMRSRFERELRRRYGSPEAASETICVERIDIVVRTWR